MPRSSDIISLIVCCWVSMCFTVSGQSNNDREFEAIRKQLATDTRAFEEAMDRASRPIQDHYLKTLLDLEAQAAKKRGYPLAIKLRDECRNLREDMVKQSVSKRRERDKRAIVLQPKDATLNGGVLFKDSVLKRWRSTSNLATWNLRSIQPGTYEVTISYSCSKEIQDTTDDSGAAIKVKAGGQIQFGENSKLIGSTIDALTHKIVKTESWTEFREDSLGRLKISNTAPSLQLKVDEIFPIDLMHLRWLKLLPLSEQQTQTNGEAIGATPERLREALDAAILRKRARLRQRHLSKLQALRKEATSTNDTAILTKLDQAIKELRKEAPSP